MKQLILFTTLLTLILFSCSKDELLIEQSLNSYALSKIEKEFFQFQKPFQFHNDINAIDRRDKTYRITPDLKRVQQYVLQENRNNRFAESINIKVGTPLWEHAYTFNSGIGESFILIPLYKEASNSINGVLSAMITSRDIVLNGMTRSTLLSNLNTNSAIKKSTLTILEKQEELLFGRVTMEVHDALCALKEINIEEHFDHNEVLNESPPPCLPELREICIDQEGGYHWFGGIENIPLHLDHDQDGIVNNKDQDWHERRFDLSQEEFTTLVMNHWNSTMFDTYGDYEDFWDTYDEDYYEYEWDDNNPNSWEDIQNFWEDIQDFWEQVWDGVDDIFDDIGDWFDDIFTPDVECPDIPLQDKHSGSSRSIECFTFYAWDCYDNPNYNWWAFYDGYSTSEILFHRVQNFRDFSIPGQVDLWLLYDIAEESECDPLSDDFEHCLWDAFNTYRNNQLVFMFEQEFPDNDDYLSMVRWLSLNCELGTNMSEYNNCIESEMISVVNQFKIHNSEIGTHLDNFLINHTDSKATKHVLYQVYLMENDAEYKNLVQASFSFSGAMWSIAIELIGDKAIDILTNLVPGLGNADEIRNAIKAVKNGDWIEFTYEAGQIIFKNTPIGKILKIGEAGSDMYIFARKVEKIWNKVDGYAEHIIEQMWVIVKTFPKPLKTNTDLIGGIAKTVKRGLKSIDDVMASIPNFPQMSSTRMKHILHGDTGGGLHHASGIITNPNAKIIDAIEPNSKGVYRIRYEYLDANGDTKTKWSTIFPDSKSEIQVAKSIENVFTTPDTDELIENGTKRLLKGYDSTNVAIEIITDLNYNIITAYPKLN